MNSTSTYPLMLGMFRAPTILQITSRPLGFERMTVWPTGKLLAQRRTAPLSKTMTVLPSSRIGWNEPPDSVGKLLIVTLTSKQTGFERGVWADLLPGFDACAAGL